MADKQFEYWDDWEIIGPNDSFILRLRKSPPSIDKERLVDIEYLCERITQYPEATLMNEDVWYRIVMLRQKAFKDRKSKELLKKVCKSILGDGRKRKNQEKLDYLKSKIHRDIAFFKSVLELKKDGNPNVEDIIYELLTNDVPEDDIKSLSGREKQTSNYENIYYSYLRIYEKLKAKLKDEEIFCFFENAADYLYYPNASIPVQPVDRSLTFVKMKTWYVKGSDMKIGS